MNCNRCGSPLPSEGYVCKQCKMMMSAGQLEQNRKWNKENQKSSNQFYEKSKEKYNLKPVIFIGAILLFLIILAILKLN